MPPFERLGEYVVIEELGKGGMGVVYKARQESLDRLVALKVLPEGLTQNEEFVKRFVREAKAAAHMVHPNVIQIYAVGEDQGAHYYAMEYVEGEDLSRRLRAGFKPTWEEATDVVMDVAKALSCAEEAGIVHRDIKPANIMIDKRGQVKVMDFGLAKAFSEETVMVTQPGMVVGTVAYMAPEQGKGEELDGRADQYSLGVVFYELLTGRVPFKGDSPTSVIYMHIHEPPPPLRALNPTVPETVERIVLKMMAKKREDRYPNAQVLIEDLKLAKKNTAAGATMMFAAASSPAASGAAERETERTMVLAGAARPVKPRKGFVGVGIAAGVLVAGVGAAYLLRSGAPPPDPAAGPAAGVEPPAPAKTRVDLQGVFAPVLPLKDDDQISLEGKPLAERSIDLEKGRNYALALKRRFYRAADAQVIVPAEEGEPPRLNRSTLDLVPDDNEVFTAASEALEAAAATDDPDQALAALAEQKRFVEGIYGRFAEKPKTGMALLERFGAYWRARQHEAAGQLRDAEAALAAVEPTLGEKERDYLQALRVKIQEMAQTAPSDRSAGLPTAGTDKAVDVNLALALPAGIPKGTRIFIDQEPLPPEPPWGTRPLKPGRRQVVFQNPYFKRVAAFLRVTPEGTATLEGSVAWQIDAPALLAAVKERLATGGTPGPDASPEALQQALAQAHAARAFALDLYQAAGLADIADPGIARLLSGREAYLAAAIAWQGGAGNPQEAQEVLARAESQGHLDRDGEALLLSIRQALGQQEMAFLISRAEDLLRRGLLEGDLDKAMADLRARHGEHPEALALQARVDQAKALWGEVQEMERLKQWVLAIEKVNELIDRYCPESAVLKARRDDIARKKESDVDAQAQKRRHLETLLAELDAARRKGDNTLVADVAGRILQLDPSHAAAREAKTEAERQVFEAAARARIEKTLERLGQLFRKERGAKDKEEYQALFTPEGWAAQVALRGAQFFDGPLVLAACRFDNLVTEVDARNLTAESAADWAVAVRCGGEEIAAMLPLRMSWRFVGGDWKIDAIAERSQEAAK